MRIFLFGGVRLAVDGRPPARLTGQMRDLFAYLVLNRNRSHSREVLATVFWGEQSEARARACLNTALWRLRTTFNLLGLINGSPVLIERDEIGFDPNGGHWLDFAEFENGIGNSLKLLPARFASADLQQLEGALTLYRGRLLEGCYQGWAQQEQERYHALYLKGLELQMHALAERGELERSISAGHQLLQIDPLCEPVHRAVMRLHVQHGQRAQALRQYEICRAALSTELGVPPTPETEDLHTEILTASPRVLDVPLPSEAALAREAIRTVRDELEAARDRIDQALQLLDSLRIPDGAANDGERLVRSR